MLRLLVTDINICRISEVLGKKRLKTSITNSTITIYNNEISDDVVEMLFANATIIGAQNYTLDDLEVESDVKTNPEQENETDMYLPVKKHESISTSKLGAKVDAIAKAPTPDKAKVEMPTQEISHNEELSAETIDSEYYVQDSSDMLEGLGDTDVQNAPTNTKIRKSEMVYRGEVYKWGTNGEEDREGEIKECVIIIQNDYQNSASDDTIALFCTTHYEERAPIRFLFRLTEGTMVDHSNKTLGLYDNCTFSVGRIKGINRKQLGDYLGTMTYEFMNTLQPTIDFCLGLKRSRTVNWAQLKILSTVSMEDLFKISESEVSDEKKVQQFLELSKNCNKKT